MLVTSDRNSWLPVRQLPRHFLPPAPRTWRVSSTSAYLQNNDLLLPSLQRTRRRLDINFSGFSSRVEGYLPLYLQMQSRRLDAEAR